MNFQKYLDKNIPSLKGKTIVVTGANSGIGFSLSKQASYKGANVVLACRNEQRAYKAINAIKEEVDNPLLSFLSYDQANFESIRNFAKELRKIKCIDSLVLNAGVFKPGKDLKTKDGFPLTTGTNYLGAFYLVNQISDLFSNGTIKQVVVVSSFGRLFAPKKYLDYLTNDKNKLVRAYFASKKMNFEFAFFIKKQFPNLSVNIMHPGIATTKIVNNELNSFSRFWSKIGEAVLKLIANSSDKSGLGLTRAISDTNDSKIHYYYPRRIFHTAGYPAYKKIELNKIKNTDLIDVSYKLLK